MTNTPLRTSYDDVPYESNPFSQTHPSRLATVATLFGLQPTSAEKCRVLELGCASGGNLIPLAEALPNSQFVGVDLSGRQIADGERIIRKTGLSNVSLQHTSIADIDDSYGQFDYILCHGVFSWVPRDLQEKIFEVCAHRLSANGIAYISYNTYPGWHMRGMIRDMLRYHAFRFDTPEQRIGQARALMDFLAQSAKQDGGAYSVLLRSELDLMKNQSDYYLYHEQLEEVNDPVYFHTFIERATNHKLRYLGESRIGTMVTGNFGPDVKKTLAVLSSDQIQTEQYLDFVRNRMFRETLLVRAEQTPNWAIKSEYVRGLHIASPSTPTSTPVDFAPESVVQFQSRSGMTVSTSNPLSKAAMWMLSEAWPATIPYTELFRSAAAKAGVGTTDDDFLSLATGLLNAHVSSDVVEIHASPMSFARLPSEKPVSLVHARVQAAEGRATVTNRRHETIRLSDLAMRLLPLLDGTRDREAMGAALTAIAVAGDLSVQRSGKPVTDPTEIREVLTGALGQVLAGLARDALLAK
jgi:methyltransferase-like protein/SAM-dependent methyltransferase